MRQLSLFDEENKSLGIEENAPEFVQNAWRKAKQDIKRNFTDLPAIQIEMDL